VSNDIAIENIIHNKKRVALILFYIMNERRVM
jgi:hypothetical protein